MTISVSDTQRVSSVIATQLSQLDVSVNGEPVDVELEARVHACETIPAMLRLRAQEQPDQLLWSFIGEDDEVDQTLTVSELDRLARRVGAMLQQLGAENQRVLLALQPGRLYCAAFWGCLYAQALAVPAYPPVSPALAERVETIARDAGAALVLTDQLVNAIGSAMHTHAPHLRDLQWIELEGLEIGSEDQWVEPEWSENDLAFLQYTSGTTADPKGVMISHKNLTANLRALFYVGLADLQNAAGQNFRDGYNWLPPYHDMGLTGMLMPVWSGGSCTMCSPMLFVRRPERWLREISQRKLNVSGGPNFAFELVLSRAEELKGESLDLSSWHVAACGAEPVRAETIERFVETFGPYGFKREAICPSYGMAEATLFISTANDGRGPLACHVDRASLARGEIVVRPHPDASTLTFVGCGPAGRELNLAIVDVETMSEVAPNRVGEIWVKGPNIGCGYWGKPELTKERFGAILRKARPGLPQGPYFRTGDHGFLYAGQLFFLGRMAELVQMHGRTYYPTDLEHTAVQACDLLTPRGGAAFTVPGEHGPRLALVHEIDERSIHAMELAPAIAAAMFREHAVQLSELVLIRRNALLRTSSGKPRRVSIREAFMQDKLKIASSWRAPGT